MAQRSWIIRARALQEDGWYTFNGLRQHFFALYGQGCPYAKEVEDDDVLQPEHSEKKGEKGEKGEKRKRDDPRIARMQGRTEAELQDWKKKLGKAALIPPKYLHLKMECLNMVISSR